MTLRSMAAVCALVLLAACSGRMGPSSEVLPGSTSDQSLAARRASLADSKGGRLVVRVKMSVHPKMAVRDGISPESTRHMRR